MSMQTIIRCDVCRYYATATLGFSTYSAFRRFMQREHGWTSVDGPGNGKPADLCHECSEREEVVTANTIINT